MLYLKNLFKDFYFLHNYFENVAFVLQRTETTFILSIKINISKILEGSEQSFFCQNNMKK